MFSEVSGLRSATDSIARCKDCILSLEKEQRSTERHFNVLASSPVDVGFCFRLPLNEVTVLPQRCDTSQHRTCRHVQPLPCAVGVHMASV